MKTLIVVINIVLALLLAGTAVSALRSSPNTPGAAHRRRAAAGKNDPGRKNAAAQPNTPKTLSREEKVKAILAADIFNPERTPNAAFGRRGNRMELTLVGTFEAGKVRGAVILCRTNTRQINPFMRMMWGGGPPGASGMMPGMPGGGRAGVRRFMAGMNQNNQRRNNDAVKQYVRLGETMPNGYTLAALTRTRATLTRGGDKMELELQMPSRNQNGGRRNAPARLNVNQQLQQAQLQTQQMMVRALMEMRGGGNRPGGNRGGGNRGGRR